MKSTQIKETSPFSWQLQEGFQSLPSLPGVYWFLGERDSVLYVGKAKNLKNRVTSYTQFNQLSPKTKTLVSTATNLKFHALESELEALLIEAELIRVHQPQFNILLKDDKTPLYIVMTKEKFPKVKTVRKQLIKQEKGIIFGPFPSAYKVRQVLYLARKIFPWCSEGEHAKRACFYSHVGLCPGVCTGNISAEKYQQSMHDLQQFLRGRTSFLLNEWKEAMLQASAQKKFEEAAELRDKIRLVQEVTSPHRRLGPDLLLPQLHVAEGENLVVQLSRFLRTQLHLPKEYIAKRIEGFDVSNTQGTKPVVSMVVFTQGQADKSEYKYFNIRLGETPNDYGMLAEAVTRRQNHPEWGVPDVIMIDGGKGQLSTVVKNWNWSSIVLSLAKDPDRIVLYFPHTKTFRFFPVENNLEAGKLLQQVRDEAHRFAKRQHVRRRTRAVIES